MSPARPLRDRYGPFALVAGESAGLGEAFARLLAARGLHLVLLARRADAPEALRMTAAPRARAAGSARGLAALALTYGAALLAALGVGWALRGHGPILAAAAADVAATLSLAGIHLAPTAWVFLGLLAAVLEGFADRQLRRFLRARRDPGAILASGVWGLFLAGLAAAPRWAWTAVGPLAITALFVGVSVPWMDRRMGSRHPGWSDRARRVPALVPRLARRR